MTLRVLVKRERLLLALIILFVILCFVDPSFPRRAPSLLDAGSLSLIISLLAASRGVELSGVLDRLAFKLFRVAGGSPARLCILLLLLTAGLSSLIMNDTAMFIFTPLALLVSKQTGVSRDLLVALTAIAANVGSSLTPIGNPQNIIIWQRYKLGFHEFVAGIAPYVLVWLIILLIISWACCSRVEKARVQAMPVVRVNKMLATSSTILILANILLGQLGHPIIGLAVTIAVLLAVGRQALRALDIALVAIFALMFMDFGEITLLLENKSIITRIATTTPPILMLTTLLLSQAISNVPTTILVTTTTTTQNWLPLTLGVNLGGTGTIIGSLANIIAIRIATTNTRTFMKYTIPYMTITTIITTLILILKQ